MDRRLEGGVGASFPSGGKSCRILDDRLDPTGLSLLAVTTKADPAKGKSFAITDQDDYLVGLPAHGGTSNSAHETLGQDKHQAFNRNLMSKSHFNVMVITARGRKAS